MFSFVKWKFKWVLIIGWQWAFDTDIRQWYSDKCSNAENVKCKKPNICNECYKFAVYFYFLANLASMGPALQWVHVPNFVLYYDYGIVIYDRSVVYNIGVITLILSKTGIVSLQSSGSQVSNSDPSGLKLSSTNFWTCSRSGFSPWSWSWCFLSYFRFTYFFNT